MVVRFRDNNYFNKVLVVETEFTLYGSWNFNSAGIALMIETDDSNDVIEYSFDGETVHGDMTPLTPSEAVMFDNRTQNKIWLRRVYSGNPVLVRIEAWKSSG